MLHTEFQDLIKEVELDSSISDNTKEILNEAYNQYMRALIIKGYNMNKEFPHAYEEANMLYKELLKIVLEHLGGEIWDPSKIN